MFISWDISVFCRIDLCFVFLAESPAEFFADNKNIAGFDNVRFICAVDLL